MGVGNENRSGTQAAACPTTLMLSYMGPPPPTKLDRDMHEGGSSTYFQNYRNDTLSKFSIPPYKWGKKSIPYTPRPDVIATKMLRSLNRNLSVPSSDISTIDSQRMKEVDDLFKETKFRMEKLCVFYGSYLLFHVESLSVSITYYEIPGNYTLELNRNSKAAQIQRIQYKDRTGTLHPLAFFKSNEYMYQCAPGMTTSYFSKYPPNFVQYKIPALVPLTYERQKKTPSIPQLSLFGIYDETGCIAYKR